jgi:hypothetical protein
MANVVSVHLAVLLLALSGGLFLGAGCASRQHQPAEVVEDDGGIERPAVPLSEEEGLTDRIGEVGVVILVVGITIGLILIPLLLFVL